MKIAGSWHTLLVFSILIFVTMAELLREEISQLTADVSRLQRMTASTPKSRTVTLSSGVDDPGMSSVGETLTLGETFDVGAQGGRRRAKPPVISYDGSADWDDYYFQFSRIAVNHGWTTDAECYEMLVERLKGDALSVAVSVVQEFEPLVRKLKCTFAASNLALARNELSARKQKVGETFETLALDLERKVAKAWPEAGSDMKEALKIEHFKNAIADPEVQFMVLLKKYGTLAEVVEEARQVKGAHETTKVQEKVRQVPCVSAENDTTSGAAVASLRDQVTELTGLVRRLQSADEPVDPTEQLRRSVETLTKQVADFKGRGPARSNGPRRVPTCFKCGKKGHVRAWCSYNQPGSSTTAEVQNETPVTSTSPQSN